MSFNSFAQVEPHSEQGSLTAIFLIVFAALFLLGMHYFQFNAGGSGLQLPFNISACLFISALLSLCLWQIALNKKLIYSRFALHFMLVAALLSVPLLYFVFQAGGFELTVQSLPRLLVLYAGCCLFLGFQQFSFSKSQLHLILYCILFGVLIQACYGFVQFYLMGQWELIDASILGYAPAHMRPFGVFQQPNVMATFMATGLMLSLYLLLFDNWRQQHWILKATLFAVPLLAAMSLVLNLSRTGFISTAIGFALFAPAFIKSQQKIKYLWLLLFMAGLVLALASFQQTPPGRDVGQMVRMGPRYETYIHCLEMILQKPLLGWAYGSFETAFLSSTRIEGDRHQMMSFGHLDHPHNELLFWVVEGGLIALLAMLFAAWKIIQLLLAVGKKNTAEACAALALIWPILLHTQTEYPFYHSIVLWLVFVFLLFFIDTKVASYRSIASPFSLSLKFLSLAFTGFMAWFLLTSLATCFYLQQYDLRGRSDFSLLEKIRNPMAFQTRYDWARLSYELVNSSGEQRIVAAQEMERWAKRVTAFMPRPEYYQNWLVSLQVQNKAEQARLLKIEAQRLYPHYFAPDKG